MATGNSRSESLLQSANTALRRAYSVSHETSQALLLVEAVVGSVTDTSVSDDDHDDDDDNDDNNDDDDNDDDDAMLRADVSFRTFRDIDMFTDRDRRRAATNPELLATSMTRSAAQLRRALHDIERQFVAATVSARAAVSAAELAAAEIRANPSDARLTSAAESALLAAHQHETGTNQLVDYERRMLYITRLALIGAQVTARAARRVAAGGILHTYGSSSPIFRTYRGLALIESTTNRPAGLVVGRNAWLRQSEGGASVFMDEELKYARKGHLSVHVVSASERRRPLRNTHFDEILAFTLAVNGQRVRPDPAGWIYGVYGRKLYAPLMTAPDVRATTGGHATAYRFNVDRRMVEIIESRVNIVDEDAVEHWDSVVPTGWTVRVIGNGGQVDDNLCAVYAAQCVVDMVMDRPRRRSLRPDVYTRWIAALVPSLVARENMYRQYSTDWVDSVVHITEWHQGEYSARVTRPWIDTDLTNAVESRPAKLAKSRAQLLM